MVDKNKITSIAPLHYQYAAVPKESIPQKYKLFPIDYKNGEVEAYEVLFFHRLMKKNYGLPSDIEFEQDSIKKLEDGRVVTLGREWKYYVQTDSGGLIQVGTEDVHTCLKIYHVLQHNQSEPSKLRLQEGEKFINALLREDQRLKGQILNIQNEIEENDGSIKLSLLSNVYLSNYRSAELMLDHAKDNEQHIKNEVLRYDARSPLTPDQNDHIEKFRPALGMYYAAAISYFFMALEGFINILYYAFLKDEIKSDFFKQQKLDERLDISTKILFMTSLCDGFKSKQRAGFLKDLTRLKNYRNFFFHSKITDALKKATFVENGFLYACDLEKESNALLPSQRHYLKRRDVLEVKKIVDSMVKDIIDMMQDDTKSLVERFVLNSLEIPFWRDKNRLIKFGSLDQ